MEKILLIIQKLFESLETRVYGLFAAALAFIEVGENFLKAETLDKLLVALDITAEELFSTNHLKETPELLKMIEKNIAQIGDNPEKLEIIYNITKSLVVK